MSYLHEPRDPRILRGDENRSVQVEMIFADDVSVAQHEDDVNEYLISLRDDPNHTVAIRTVDLKIATITGNGNLTGVTLVHYLLIGTTDLPYLP